MKTYRYETNCVNSNGNDILAMVDRAREVGYETIRHHCQGLREWEEDMGYTRKKGAGLKLPDDWAVGFFKSVFRGRPCFYIEHSRIEYIWVLDPAFAK